ncbi:uncharacterized protein LOC135397305 [Ornithodoros turicata]|uniref:uncharacterized protein LOC135397305 n=1 Tax=Ornithodoros turicata TaxID=34597 RepID=UPI003138DEF0
MKLQHMVEVGENKVAYHVTRARAVPIGCRNLASGCLTGGIAISGGVSLRYQWMDPGALLFGTGGSLRHLANSYRTLTERHKCVRSRCCLDLVTFLHDVHEMMPTSLYTCECVFEKHIEKHQEGSCNLEIFGLGFCLMAEDSLVARCPTCILA